MHIQRQADSFAYRMAASLPTEDELSGLQKEFDDWWDAIPEDKRPRPDGNCAWNFNNSPITSWENVEKFLSEHYPQAHSGAEWSEDAIGSAMGKNYPDYVRPVSDQRTLANMIMLHRRSQGLGLPNRGAWTPDEAALYNTPGMAEAIAKGRNKMQRDYQQRNMVQANTIRCAVDEDNPIDLYRGLSIDHPALVEMAENLGLDHPDFLNALLDHVQAGVRKPGLGIHWSTDPNVSKKIYAPGGALQVVLGGSWNGKGRSYNQMHQEFARKYDWDTEIPLASGAPVNVHTLFVRNKPGRWTKIKLDPREMTARKLLSHNTIRCATSAGTTVSVGSEYGLHMTPSCLISNRAKRHGIPVFLVNEQGDWAVCDDPMQIMALGAGFGHKITVHADNPDVEADIADYVSQNHD